LNWIGESKEDKTDLEVGLDLDKEFLEVLNDGAVDSATKICMLIGHLPCLVADTVENILKGGKRGNRRILQGRTWRPPSPRNWLPERKGTWMMAAILVISRAEEFSMSAMPSK